MFVIQHGETRRYVRKIPRNATDTISSYTGRLEEAETFSSREVAQRHCCPESDRVVPLSFVLQRPTES